MLPLKSESAGTPAFTGDVAVRDGRILFVDSRSEAQSFKGATTRVIDAGGGTVVNMSSTAGQVGYGRRTPYAAAKSANSPLSGP